MGFAGDRRKWILFNALNLKNPIKRFPLAKAAFEMANARRGDLEMRVAHDLPHAMLPLYAAACDVILCTSETEGWPNSVKEALACNVPFVSTDVSDLREIARQEPTCRVCAPDAAALAGGICAALETAGSSELRKYVAPMSLEATSNRLVGIYESLVARRRPSRSASAHVSVGD